MTEARILSRVEQRDGCWIWTGQILKPSGKNKGGYGILTIASNPTRNQLTHRLFYEIFIGPIPVGLEIDHLCRNRACCNPTHLEPVTRRENLRRGLMGVLLTGELREHLSAVKRGKPRPWTESSFEQFAASIKARRAALTHCKHGHAYDPDSQFTEAGYLKQCSACRAERRARAQKVAA